MNTKAIILILYNNCNPRNVSSWVCQHVPNRKYKHYRIKNCRNRSHFELWIVKKIPTYLMINHPDTCSGICSFYCVPRVSIPQKYTVEHLTYFQIQTRSIISKTQGCAVVVQIWIRKTMDTIKNGEYCKQQHWEIILTLFHPWKKIK